MQIHGSAGPGSQPCVLIAEDQFDVVEALRIALKQEGIETHAVNSPEAVLPALSARQFDLLLMDLNYTRDTTSGAEGLDLLAQVQRFDQRLPVIAMTAWGSVDLAVEAMRRGAADFIQKPWDNWRLIGMLRSNMERSRQRRKLETEHQREIREAGEMQRRLLGKHINEIPGIEMAVDWRPARELGGDFFDVMHFKDGTVGLCIADVEGKGVPAALVMSNLQSAVKAFASPEVQPRDLCQRLNKIFCEEVRTEKSISLFYGQLEPSTRKLVYCNAGHWPPLVIRRTGEIHGLDKGGAVLGWLPKWDYEQEQVNLNSGDSIALFTDGITEAEDQSQYPFGTVRLSNCVRSCEGMRTPDIPARVLSEVARHCNNEFQDDATFMILSVA